MGNAIINSCFTSNLARTTNNVSLKINCKALFFHHGETLTHIKLAILLKKKIMQNKGYKVVKTEGKSSCQFIYLLPINQYVFFPLIRIFKCNLKYILLREHPVEFTYF